MGLPLFTLLSEVLVAFTIEFDNEFEHRTPHRTTQFGSGSGPWLVSMVMWSNCMRFVTDEGLTVRELEDLARTKTNLNGMQRWGYISTQGPPRSGVIRATPKGRQAREVWRALFGEIEKRWQARFGPNEIGQLRESLGALNSRIDADLPDCLPILGYGLFSGALERKRERLAGSQDELSLPALLSRVLLAFAIEFESESDLSLAISANVLRVLDETGVRVRDLPLLSGVSKEAISMALGFLKKKSIAVVEPDPAGSRAKIARLTPKGRAAQDAYHKLVEIIEERWKARFGERSIRVLREQLQRLVVAPSAIEPYPDGWRARVPKPGTWPHYPMVLHRGGFPDGS
ncbi:MAG: MarR family winged helix-turn-helix transcriptional regulator [Bryobacteraceae bacterium]